MNGDKNINLECRMKKKKWLLAADHNACAESMAGELGLSRLTTRVLAARGFDTRQKAQAFMTHSLEGIHDPFLLKDMDKAVAEIRRAIENKEKIAVYGDYDVDGVTATCIMIQYLKKMGADCTYYIPDRLEEGYGLNVAAIQSLYDDGCRLLITPRKRLFLPRSWACGSSSPTITNARKNCPTRWLWSTPGVWTASIPSGSWPV